ncbi:hypothetical protein P3T76_014533 [Phytophthora citrophthora]|uniref:Uncharacterized protein n=1 Tax=Phytophthora citrophthora TaxID=4793 RepID=A0AAD9LB80_9STRA|nr:hypothetical protein P3T76_014533 [Phytophthora citrophthora]
MEGWTKVTRYGVSKVLEGPSGGMAAQNEPHYTELWSRHLCFSWKFQIGKVVLGIILSFNFEPTGSGDFPEENFRLCQGLSRLSDRKASDHLDRWVQPKGGFVPEAFLLRTINLTLEFTFYVASLFLSYILLETKNTRRTKETLEYLHNNKEQVDKTKDKCVNDAINHLLMY